jgi:hypothetical protein
VSILSSLSNRIFLASALLTVLSIGVAVFVINRTATARAEEDLERSLEEAGTLVEQFQSLLFEHLVREARLIADLPKLKAAVSVDHEPTVRPLAADYRRQTQQRVKFRPFSAETSGNATPTTRRTDAGDLEACSRPRRRKLSALRDVGTGARRVPHDPGVMAATGPAARL